jgi:hypothetical protein
MGKRIWIPKSLWTINWLIVTIFIQFSKLFNIKKNQGSSGLRSNLIFLLRCSTTKVVISWLLCISGYTFIELLWTEWNYRLNHRQLSFRLQLTTCWKINEWINNKNIRLGWKRTRRNQNFWETRNDGIFG